MDLIILFCRMSILGIMGYYCPLYIISPPIATLVIFTLTRIDWSLSAFIDMVFILSIIRYLTVFLIMLIILTGAKLLGILDKTIWLKDKCKSDRRYMLIGQIIMTLISHPIRYLLWNYFNSTYSLEQSYQIIALLSIVNHIIGYILIAT